MSTTAIEVGQTYLLKMNKTKNRDLPEDLVVSKIEKIDEKGCMVKVVSTIPGYEPKYFRIPYFEWLIYTGDIIRHA